MRDMRYNASVRDTVPAREAGRTSQTHATPVALGSGEEQAEREDGDPWSNCCCGPL